MQFRSLATVLFAALAMASPAPQVDVNALLGSLPSSIIAEAVTALPASVIQAFANPTEAAAIIGQIEAGNIPSWYSSLPADLKAWASSAAVAEMSMMSMAAATATPTPTGAAATSSGAAATTTASATASSSTAMATSSAHANSTASTSTTSNAGASGSVAMGLAGVAGMLAVALAL